MAPARSPHHRVGQAAERLPERLAPASSSMVTLPPRSGVPELAPGAGVGSADEGGAGAAGPTRSDTTTNRSDALNRGLQVVRVSRLSVVGSSTDTSLGRTTLVSRTRYSKAPWAVVTKMWSPGLSSLMLKKGAPYVVRWPGPFLRSGRATPWTTALSTLILGMRMMATASPVGAGAGASGNVVVVVAPGAVVVVLAPAL